MNPEKDIKEGHVDPEALLNIADDLKREKKRFKALFENVGTAIFVANPETQEITDCNQKATELLGYSKEEIKGMKVGELPAKEVREKALEKFKKATKKGLKSYETKITTKDNEKIPVIISASPAINIEEGKKLLASFHDITELKEKERKIREKEEKFRNYVENAPHGIFVADKEGNYVEVNGKACEMTGYSKEELLEMNITDVIPPEASEKGIKCFKTVKETGEASSEVTFLKKDGSKGDWLLKAVKLSEERCLGFAVDITERKKAQEKVKKEKKRFQQIFNNVNDALYLHEFDEEENKPGKFLRVNDVACEMLGYTKEEFMEMSPADIDSEENKEQIPEVMDELFSTGSVRFEGYHVTKDGEKIPVELNSNLFEIEGEKRIITAARDITQRKKEESKKKSFAEIVEKADVGAIVTDTDGVIKKANKTAERLFGEKIKEGENFGIPISSDERKEINIIKKDGSIGTGKLTSAKTTWRGEEAYTIFITDITKQKEAEKKIKEEVEKLKELQEMKTKFLTMSSHELKTPLTPIKAQLQFLKSGEVPCEEQEEKIETVLNNVNRLQKLVEDIMDISKMESGEIKIKREKQDLKEVIMDVVKTFSREDIEIKTHIEDNLPEVPIDRERISQVLVNLLENAIKHSGGTKVDITVEKKEDKVKVSVEDNGRGISEDKIEDVFEPFHREREKKLAPGTGLGLAISRRIVEKHGGEIWAESEEGEGTSVYFTISLEKKEESEE